MRCRSALLRSSHSKTLFQCVVSSLVRFSTVSKSSEELSSTMEWHGPLPEAQVPSNIEDLANAEEATSGSDIQRGIKRQRESGLIDGPILDSEMRVSRSTSPHSLSRALLDTLRSKGSCRVLTSGDEALNQFVKGIAASRILFHRTKEGDVHFQANHAFWLDRNSTNQLVIQVQRTETPLEKSEKSVVFRVRRDTDIRGLAKLISHALRYGGSVEVHAMGSGALAKSVLAFIWSRRFSMADGVDVDCYPSFQNIPGLDPAKFKLLSLILVRRQISPDLHSSKSQFAILPMPFPMPKEKLKPIEEVFNGMRNVDLPMVKISSDTHPNKAASCLLTYLRSCNGVQLFSTGCLANNQSFKAITICRTYIRELSGFDLGFQPIHAPRMNRNGECQVVNRVQLIADPSKRLQSLEGDQIRFKIGNNSDAKIVGEAMAGQIKFSRRIHCTVIGIVAKARFLVALSHARIQIASEKTELVALPLFEDSAFMEESKVKNVGSVVVDILAL